MWFQFKKHAEHVIWHLTGHGVIALLLAVAALIMLRGLEPGIIVLFGIPPVYAASHTRPPSSSATRGVAWTFLGLIGIGALVASSPALFPKLGGGIGPGLVPWHDRMLTWYTGVYLFFFVGVLPVYALGSSLLAHRAGRRPKFSPAICYVGLVVDALLWFSLPGFLTSLGFWPVL